MLAERRAERPGVSTSGVSASDRSAPVGGPGWRRGGSQKQNERDGGGQKEGGASEGRQHRARRRTYCLIRSALQPCELPAERVRRRHTAAPRGVPAALLALPPMICRLALLALLCAAAPAAAQSTYDQAALGALLDRSGGAPSAPVRYATYRVESPSGNSVLARHALYERIGEGDAELGLARAEISQLLGGPRVQDLRMGDTVTLPATPRDFDWGALAYAPYPQSWWARRASTRSSSSTRRRRRGRPTTAGSSRAGGRPRPGRRRRRRRRAALR